MTEAKSPTVGEPMPDSLDAAIIEIRRLRKGWEEFASELCCRRFKHDMIARIKDLRKMEAEFFCDEGTLRGTTP